MIHAETSTGVCNPAEQISQLLAGSDTLFILDTVTSLGGIPVKIDEWGVDIAEVKNVFPALQVFPLYHFLSEQFKNSKIEKIRFLTGTLIFR